MNKTIKRRYIKREQILPYTRTDPGISVKSWKIVLFRIKSHDTLLLIVVSSI